MNQLKELWEVFWSAFKETPKGMYAPFAAFFSAALKNPVLTRDMHVISGSSGKIV